MSFFSVATALGLLARSTLADDGLIGGCESYGKDFQGGGEYFQNVNSAENFTFVQDFEGCQNANSTNILVDPNGGQYTCSNTPMQPDDTDEMSTCPLLKNQLWSGAWSLLILSNNGADGAPIAFERDFLLDVGVQTTISVTPTVTASTVIVPTINTTTTTTTTSAKTLPPSTTTVPSTTVQKTYTVTPQPVWSTKTITLATVTVPKVSVAVNKVVKTVTASCHVPSRQPSPDPFCKIWPSQASAQQIVKSAAHVANTPVPSLTKVSAKYGGGRNMYSWLHHDRAQWLRARDERLGEIQGVGRRAPDAQPLTVTEQDSSKFITVTSTSTTSAVTSTNFVTATATSTVTPAPVTVVNGKTYLPPSTVTLATPTSTRTVFTIAKVTTTRVQTVPITITTTYAPAASKTACRSKGGMYY
ncbi:hypothetical protein DIS24_g262 [Lasiodiplodia hormozganensis]|uniref:Uncharacterized protein n=1 Tax=Lasiodiplodia hormozganensis TaxID=869390 RepID=A0AA40D6T1_9PEZI|nr:hypothetical protein DIS24_g262 [Lasiodiplodia hormozganensis]